MLSNAVIAINYWDIPPNFFTREEIGNHPQTGIHLATCRICKLDLCCCDDQVVHFSLVLVRPREDHHDDGCYEDGNAFRHRPADDAVDLHEDGTALVVAVDLLDDALAVPQAPA